MIVDTEYAGKIDTSKITITNVRDNWVIGKIGDYQFQAKAFESPSEYGIEDGRISKLYISCPKDGCLVNYDRGWDIRPSTSQATEAMEIILAAFA